MKILATLLITLFIGVGHVDSTIEVGQPAPEIDMENPQGIPTKLSSLKGHIVLVDFWASWCKPCQQSRPIMKSVYDEFKTKSFKNAKGFEIFSVSLDSDKEAWTKAIKKYGLQWQNHVSDLKRFESDVVNSYNINSIPSNVLLNEKGEIVGKNLFGEDLEEALKKLQ